MKAMNVLKLLVIAAMVIMLHVDASQGKKRGVRRQAVVAKREQRKKEIAVKEEPVAAAESVVSDVRKDLESATEQAAKQITECTLTKNRARRSMAMKLMTQEEADAVINEQDQKIAKIKQDLKKALEEALAVADEAEKQTSSVQQFISGAQRFGAQGLSKITSYFGYSQEDKDLAKAIIAELERLKFAETDPAIREEIEKEIYAQKLITGQEWSTQKYLLLGVATTAALVAGVSLGSALLKSPSAEDLTTVTVNSPNIPADWIPSYPGEEQPFVRGTPGDSLAAAKQLGTSVGVGFTELTPEEPTIIPTTPGSKKVGKEIQEAAEKAVQGAAGFVKEFSGAMGGPGIREAGKEFEELKDISGAGKAVASKDIVTEFGQVASKIADVGRPGVVGLTELTPEEPTIIPTTVGSAAVGAKIQEATEKAVQEAAEGTKELLRVAGAGFTELTPEEPTIMPTTTGSAAVGAKIQEAAENTVQKAATAVKKIPGLMRAGIGEAGKEFEELKDISGAGEAVASKDIGTELGQVASKIADVGRKSISAAGRGFEAVQKSVEEKGLVGTLREAGEESMNKVGSTIDEGINQGVEWLLPEEAAKVREQAKKIPSVSALELINQEVDRLDKEKDARFADVEKNEVYQNYLAASNSWEKCLSSGMSSDQCDELKSNADEAEKLWEETDTYKEYQRTENEWAEARKQQTDLENE